MNYDIDDPAWHLGRSFTPTKTRRGGWGLVAPQVHGGDSLRVPSMSGAACAGADPELFFDSRNRHHTVMAKRICRNCPVKQRCLNEAMQPNEVDGRTFYASGIWGGTTDAERARMRSNGHEAIEVAEIVKTRNDDDPSVFGMRRPGDVRLRLPTPQDDERNRIEAALQAGKIVIDRGSDPALILPKNAEGLAAVMESQGYRRIKHG